VRKSRNPLIKNIEDDEKVKMARSQRNYQRADRKREKGIAMTNFKQRRKLFFQKEEKSVYDLTNRLGLCSRKQE